MSKKVFISTAIPYVNAKPHIGHALEFVQADAVARYRRLIGDDVFFLSGTDDNSLKNVLKAEEAGEEVQAFVRRHAENFKELERKLNISTDYFIETSSDPLHKEGAQKLWKETKSEDMYQKEYTGLYCVGCEEFKTEKELVNGHCAEHPNALLEKVSEQNYFFKLSNYSDYLKDLLKSGELEIVPASRKNEAVSFIEGGLEDFSISRSMARAHDWGVVVPDDASQVMYVWYDALANYITALDYAHEGEKFEHYWNGADERIHVIGKGINRFHTIYWPAMLRSAGVKPPTQVFIHGYITVDGQKMSKSIGNVIDPDELISLYGAEAVRYLFLRHINPFEDSDLTREGLKEAYNANLANGLGNLTARIMKMAEDNLDAPIAHPEKEELPGDYIKLFAEYELQKAADLIWKRVGELDERITLTLPFKVVKEDPIKGKELISALARDLYTIGRLLAPFMPETGKIIKEAVLANKKPETLFARID